MSLKILSRIGLGIPAPVYEIMNERSITLAGGAVRDLARNEKPKDFDLFCPDIQLAKQYADEFVQLVHGSGIRVRRTKHSFECRSADLVVQFIHAREYHHPQDTFRQFDFVPCMGAVRRGADGVLEGWMHPDFYKSARSKRLQVNDDVRDPVNSMYRVMKFAQRGWSISKSDFARLLGMAHEDILKRAEEAERECHGSGAEPLGNVSLIRESIGLHY